MNRGYPPELVLKNEDFDMNECQDILSAATDYHYRWIHTSFSSAAKNFIEFGDIRKGKLYWILSDACSMTLRSHDNFCPFDAYCIFDGKRSVIPSDFKKIDIDFFDEILPTVTDALLKARLADLIWVTQKNIECAYTAIKSYINISLCPKKWHEDGSHCWERAIVLSKALGSNTSEYLIRIESEIIKKFFTLNEKVLDDANFSAALADLMLKHNLCKDFSEQIAKKLEINANHMEKQNIWIARNIIIQSVKWYQLCKQTEKQIELKFKYANYSANEAKSNFDDKYIQSVIECHNAIDLLRQIPNAYRSQYNVNGKINEMQKLLAKAGEKVSNEMTAIQSPPINIDEMKKEAKQAIFDSNTITQALVEIALATPYFSNIEKHVENAIQLMQKFPISNLFPQIHFDNDRVVGITPGISPTDLLNAQTPAVRASVLRHYSIECILTTRGYILPMLEEIRDKYEIEEKVFIEIVTQSPAVPKEHVDLIVKGFYHAIRNNDFLTALSILIPQLESIVRHLFQENGIETTRVDQGIESENGICALIKNPESIKVLGEDIIHEIQALFCDPVGANFRNKHAHGLLPVNAYNSDEGIYAWWFIFRLVVIFYINRQPD